MFHRSVRWRAIMAGADHRIMNNIIIRWCFTMRISCIYTRTVRSLRRNILVPGNPSLSSHQSIQSQCIISNCLWSNFTNYYNTHLHSLWNNAFSIQLLIFNLDLKTLIFWTENPIWKQSESNYFALQLSKEIDIFIYLYIYKVFVRTNWNRSIELDQ